MRDKFPFVVRVYGIFYDPERGVLVSDELIYNQKITKFPGGGLEFGEGTKACLEREMLEETQTKFEIIEHFYTTDFFAPSAFNDQIQVLSIYYLIRPKTALNFIVSKKEFDFKEENEGSQSFRFIKLSNIGESDFTLIIDKVVGKMLKKEFNK